MGAIALLAAPLVLRMAWVAVAPPTVSLGSILAGDNPDVALSAARVATQGEADAPLRRRMEAARNQSPLAEEPFLVDARQALERGETARVVALLEEVRRRNPRQRQARMLLVEAYAREELAQPAVREVVALHALMPETDEVLVAQLAALASNPQTAAATASALRNDRLVDPVLEYLAAHKAPVTTILSLARGRQSAPGDPPRWQAILVNNLVDAGEPAQAFRLWRGFYDRGAAAGEVYDGKFRGLPGRPPFGWQFRADDFGTSEISKRGGLEVAYYGRASGELARQIVMLPSGTYELESEIEADAKFGSARLQWSLACAAKGAPLTALPLTSQGGAPQRFKTRFTVPRNCPAQALILEGVAPEIPETIYARIISVVLRSAEKSRS